jgi:hypothetical protein
MKNFKIISIKNPSWKLLFTSILIATLTTYLISRMYLPDQFIITDLIKSANFIELYHDFDNDGYSELLELNIMPEANRYFIYIKDWNGRIIDQTNYWDAFQPTSIMFGDITDDGYDEIITLAQSNDSLFLYVHDINKKKSIIHRLYFDILSEPRIPNEQTAMFLIGIIIKDKYNGHNIAIFGVNSFTSLKPRSIYAIDLNDRKIKYRFDTHCALSRIFPYDLTGDGIDEIIVTSVAYGNMPDEGKYRDDTCWLFALDQKLSPVFSPLNFSEYPAEFYCLPIEVFSDKYLLAFPDYLGEKNITREIYLINAQGKIHQRYKDPFGQCKEYSPVVSLNRNPSELYGWYGNNDLKKLDHKFETLKKVSTEFDFIRPLVINDLNMDGSDELLCISDHYFSVYDTQLNLLAKYFKSTRHVDITFRENGPHNPLDINLRINNTRIPDTNIKIVTKIATNINGINILKLF